MAGGPKRMELLRLRSLWVEQGFFFGGGKGTNGRMDISSALEIPISHSNFDIRKAVGNTSVDTGRARDVKECCL